MPELTHFDDHGASRMVDTSAKPETLREARASARVRMAAATAALIRDRAVAKGDVLEVARLAGIMAAKRTADLIPLCHPLPLTAVQVELRSVDRLIELHRFNRKLRTIGLTPAPPAASHWRDELKLAAAKGLRAAAHTVRKRPRVAQPYAVWTPPAV